MIWLNWLYIDFVIRGLCVQNLAKNELNILCLKFSFGMNDKGQKTLAVRGSNQKVLETIKLMRTNGY